jgi:very-short-patch-repair endonuclease
MLTGVFRDRTRMQRLAAQTAHHALAQLIQSNLLLPHRAARGCEIGPFIVEYVFRRRSLVVELEPRDEVEAVRAHARAAFLNEMGYSVLSISRRELRAHPRRVLAQIKAALR